MTRTLLRFVSIGGVVGLVAACTITTDGDKYPNSDSFCDAKASEECSQVSNVCGVTVDNCKAKVKPTCTQAAADAVAQGRVYTASLAEGCITKVHDLYSTATVDQTKSAEVDDNCARVFAGNTAKSQPCTSDFQCTGALVCDKGVCAEKVVKNADDPCNNPGDVCATGFYCGPRGTSNFCNAKKKENEICTPNNPCAEDLVCVGDAGGGDCKQRGDAGATCTVDSDCKSNLACLTAGTTKACAQKSFAFGSAACKDVGGPG